MGMFSSLNREQKEAIGLLQIGTFLEYFDLALFVHMAVLLNDLFFPTDIYSGAMLSAAAFCSTYVFRPIGALFFGWIGDHLGRKKTIVITTAMMALSCIVMANLPTYAQVGILATWIVTACRALQGMSSLGEIIGAKIYLTETFQRPVSYPIVSSLSISVGLGSVAALGVATLVTSLGFNWRIAFWVGATIAIVGAVARTRLRETPEFLKMQRKWLRKGVEEINVKCDPIHGAEFNATWKEPVDIKTLMSYFFIACGWPLCFYLTFIYFNPMLKENFGFSSADIIRHNFFLSIISVFVYVLFTYLSSRVHPIIISKVRGICGLFLMILIPFCVLNISSPIQLFLMQTLILFLSLDEIPLSAVIFSHFPLYLRVTYAGILFAFSRTLIYIVTSFGLVYLGNYFGHFGILLISLPVGILYLYGVLHFEKLEYNRKLIPNLSVK